MARYSLEASKRAAERDDEVPEPPEAWSLNDFDDLLYAVRRSALFPIGDEDVAYPS